MVDRIYYEVWINLYTLTYMKEIVNKGLLYSKRGVLKIKQSLIICMWNETEDEYISVHIPEEDSVNLE